MGQDCSVPLQEVHGLEFCLISGANPHGGTGHAPKLSKLGLGIKFGPFGEHCAAISMEIVKVQIRAPKSVFIHIILLIQ
jgi:hypothetical protein